MLLFSLAIPVTTLQEFYDEYGGTSEWEKAKPPTSLPGGFTVGEKIYFSGKPWKAPNGDKLEYGAKGEVVGPATKAELAGKGVSVKFPGNRTGINCFAHQLSRRSIFGA